MKKKNIFYLITISLLIFIIIKINYQKKLLEISLWNKEFQRIEYLQDSSIINKLESLSDDNILNLIKESRKSYHEVFISFDVNQPLSAENPIYYKIVEPYDTIEKRENKLKEYFVDYTLLSKITENESKYEFNKLVKKDGSYYFCPIQLSIEDAMTYTSVVSREYEGNNLYVKVEGESINTTNRCYILTVSDGQVKIVDTYLLY